MKMRKRIAALIAVAMIAALMPMTAFAASDNEMNKTVNVEKDKMLTKEHGVNLFIKLKNGEEFTSGAFFELELTDAEWDKDELVAAFGAGLEFDKDGKQVGTKVYSMRRESGSSLIITALPGSDEVSFTIPMVAKITGDDPTVKINPIDSSISAGKYPLVNSTTGKAIVTVGKVPTIAGTDEMAEITFDEPFINAFKGGEIEIELRDSDFSFVDKGTVVGTKSFHNAPGFKTEINAKGNLIITVPTNLGKDQRGGIKLSGVEIKPNRNAREGEVKVTIDNKTGKTVDKQVATVAKYGDYTTKLEVEKDDYAVVAGKDIDVEFTLSEEMAGALIGKRTVAFEFSKGIIINTIDLVSAKKDQATILSDIMDSDKAINTIDHINGVTKLHTNVFEVDNFNPEIGEKASYKFKANLLVPAGYEGDIVLTAEGRGLEDKKEVVVAKTEAPVTVEVKATTIKVGLKEQETDAKIVIKETKEDRLTKGKDIVVEIDDLDKGLKFVSADIKVTDGDLELVDKDDFVVDGGKITFEVKRHSTEPSTIEITNIVVGTDRSVPQGKYDIKVGGSAISDFTKTIHFGDKKSALTSDKKNLESPVLDEVIVSKDAIIVGTPNTEDINKGKKAVVNFVIGNNKYLVDGIEMEMDAAPYIKDGRTMVPLRYLSTALGVDTESIKFNAGVVTIFAEAGKVIQVSVGSKDLVVNGMTIPMLAAAEIIDGRTYVPVAEIGGVFGVSGSWDAATQTATFK